jgi:hypothetical protein
MTELALKCIYTNKPKTKFFNDKEPKEYHQFLVLNPEIIPDEYVYYTDSKKNCSF